jgi:hypothetical protein
MCVTYSPFFFQVFEISFYHWFACLLALGHHLQGISFIRSMIEHFVDNETSWKIICSISWISEGLNVAIVIESRSHNHHGIFRLIQACGHREEVRYLLWIRLSRVRKVTDFFQKMEKDIRINYLFTRIVKLIVVELYCTHTAACIFYHLATTLPSSQEGYTWIGSLKMGDYSYTSFREIDIWKRYTTSLYFAVITMATVGELLLTLKTTWILWFSHFVYITIWIIKLIWITTFTSITKRLLIFNEKRWSIDLLNWWCWLKSAA